MKRFVSLLVFAAMTLVVAAPARSQPPAGGRGFGGGGLLMLAAQKSVQTDLKMTEEQTKSVESLVAKSRESMSGLRDLSPEDRRSKMRDAGAANEKALAEALSADQVKRLKQISIQAAGPGAVERPEVAEALALTSEQKEKIQGISSDLRGEMRDAGTGEEAASKRSAARKAATEKMLGAFTAEQKAKWSELTGAPFAGELRGLGGRRGGGGEAPGGGRRQPSNST